MALPDEALLEAWRASDSKAGSALFRRFFPQCRRFFVTKVPERDIEDLLQRTLTAMVEARDRFRGDASFRTFVLSIAPRPPAASWPSSKTTVGEVFDERPHLGRYMPRARMNRLDRHRGAPLRE